ncbi:hypothetical protein [Micromonospora sp.]
MTTDTPPTVTGPRPRTQLPLLPPLATAAFVLVFGTTRAPYRAR